MPLLSFYEQGCISLPKILLTAICAQIVVRFQKGFVKRCRDCRSKRVSQEEERSSGRRWLGYKECTKIAMDCGFVLYLRKSQWQMQKRRRSHHPQTRPHEVLHSMEDQQRYLSKTPRRKENDERTIPRDICFLGISQELCQRHSTEFRFPSGIIWLRRNSNGGHVVIRLTYKRNDLALAFCGKALREACSCFLFSSQHDFFIFHCTYCRTV